MYLRTLQTLLPLDQFKSFTMHLVVPWSWNSKGRHKSARSLEAYEHYRNERTRLERNIGRKFMGENVDRLLIDSKARIDSQWLELTWTKYEVLFDN